jgi:hypothetical protein
MLDSSRRLRIEVFEINLPVSLGTSLAKRLISLPIQPLVASPLPDGSYVVDIGK